jgi:hypothetical protein
MVCRSSGAVISTRFTGKLTVTTGDASVGDAMRSLMRSIRFLFAPLYAREPVIMYSNQLAREVWRYEAPFPLSAVGYAAEPLSLQAYRRTPLMTISAPRRTTCAGWVCLAHARSSQCRSTRDRPTLSLPWRRKSVA